VSCTQPCPCGDGCALCRFQAKRKGWDDPAGRQIAHYFDEQQWQQQCATPKKVKLSKKAVKHFKEKNKKKVPSYLLGD
jgi:hypothetical protein